jgi:hypothetical protein
MIAAPVPLIASSTSCVAKPWTLTWLRSPWKMGWWWFSGVLVDHDGKLVPKTRAEYQEKGSWFWPRTGIYGITPF